MATCYNNGEMTFFSVLNEILSVGSKIEYFRMQHGSDTVSGREDEG